jgi:DNA-binding MarR family transcriptional regulator
MPQTLPRRPRISLLLRLLDQHYARAIEVELTRAGFGDLRSGQAKVFVFVPPEGIAVGELADLAGVRKQSMAEAVEQLVTAGYLERRANPQDRRSRLIFLTARGEAVRPAAIKAGDRVEAQWAALTSVEFVENLRGDLRTLLDQLSGGEQDTSAG